MSSEPSAADKLQERVKELFERACPQGRLFDLPADELLEEQPAVTPAQ